MTDENFSLAAAIDEIVKRTGWSRRKAKRWMIKNLANGKIRSSAGMIVDNLTGKVVSSERTSLPKEFWQADEYYDEDEKL